MTEQERRALFFKTTGRLASIDKQSYYAFCCGVASRDADIQRLQMALADTEALEIGTAEKCGQLRAELAAALAIQPDDAALKAWLVEPVGVFANVNSMTPELGARWEHMADESHDGVDYIYLYSPNGLK